MDYSDYTLVSFGDSFTFGQGTVDHYFDADYDSEEWRRLCHSKSYTRFVSDQLNFKNIINFGLPGNTNNNIVFQIENFLRDNIDKKIFILYNLTQQIRVSTYLLNPNFNRFELKHLSLSNNHGHAKMPQYWLDMYFDSYRNGAQLIHEHVDLLHRLDTIFARYGVRNLGVDILGDIPKIIRSKNLRVEDIFLPDEFQYQSFEPYKSFIDSVYKSTRYIKDLSVFSEFGNGKYIYDIYSKLTPSVIADDGHFTVTGNQLFANTCVKLIKQGEYND